MQSSVRGLDLSFHQCILFVCFIFPVMEQDPGNPSEVWLDTQLPSHVCDDTPLGEDLRK